MSVTTQPTSQTPATRQQPRRLWKVPTSKAWWLSLAACILIYAIAFAWYWHTKGYLSKTPGYGSLAILGILTFGIVALTAAYTLRRRFVRILPGKVQDWLWAHNWLGILAVLTAMLHSNFDHVLHDMRFAPQYFFFTNNGGAAALYALICLVASGIINRLLYFWQSRVISTDAGSNGVGIAQSLEERILELEYTIERLYAGKSNEFKQYCIGALRVARGQDTTAIVPLSALPPQEQTDFQSAQEMLSTRTQLLQSLRRQQRARQIINRWRVIHITIACLAVTVICLHVSVAIVQGLMYRFKLKL
ncbi:MAG TPA: hypothetical protein VNG51_15590 [Ktedonobacteraceae bacterium]|nr:hypothetical protein [Ktedonobacteraceae bacterium]